MKRARNPWLPVFRALSLLTLGGVWAVACGGPQEPGAAGSVCFRTDDCKDGLACVPTAAGSPKSVCSADLGVIVAMVDGAPPDSTMPTQDASNGAAGATTTGDSASGVGGKPAAAGGAGGKTATGGAGGSASGGKSSGGAPSGGSPAGGAPSGGSGVAGSGTGGSATGGAATNGGTGGSAPVDAGNG